MREIKFRKWDFEAEEMIPGDALAFEHYAPITDLLTQEGIMQYTGSKDEYGIEIYEGDILEFTDTGEEGHEYREGYDFRNRASVCFENGRFELEKFLSKDSGVLDEMNSEDHETFIGNFKFAKVIGNIYEHPHLLEEK